MLDVVEENDEEDFRGRKPDSPVKSPMLHTSTLPGANIKITSRGLLINSVFVMPFYMVFLINR